MAVHSYDINLGSIQAHKQIEKSQLEVGEVEEALQLLITYVTLMMTVCVRTREVSHNTPVLLVLGSVINHTSPANQKPIELIDKNVHNP